MPSGSFEFKLRRPTQLQMQRMTRGYIFADLIVEFVVDWKGVTEQALVGGDNVTPIPFDKELWAEWIADKKELWPPIVEALNDLLLSYAKEQEDSAKNLKAS